MHFLEIQGFMLLSEKSSNSDSVSDSIFIVTFPRGLKYSGNMRGIV